MSDILEAMFLNIDTMMKSCFIDFKELKKSDINKHFFEEYNNTRIVNSFLFNFGKLQDKIGAKLFKQVLYELREIDEFSLTMIDVLHKLELLDIIENIEQWDKLREIRNILAHEYPFDIEERVENIALAMNGFISLQKIYLSLKKKVTI
jgi:hypothetical protein